MKVSAAAVSAILAFGLLLVVSKTALATPSHQIWIPSTDVQPFLLAHLDIDNYLRLARNEAAAGGRDPNLLDLGFRIGLLPFEKVRLEAGFDYLTTGHNPNDQHPWSGNIKLATPEGSIASFSPALAVGIYQARPVAEIFSADAPHVYSGQNLVYGLVAETIPPLGSLPSLGRFTVGYYRGCRRALVDSNDPAVAKAENSGLLFSWDRTLKEISDKLWMAVDYQGGNNVDGAVSIGLAWRFTGKISLLVGYNIYTQPEVAGKDTLTTQLNIDFP